MRRTGPTNVYLRRLIGYLRKKARENEAPIWYTVAEHLEKPARIRPEVNVGRINRHTSSGDVVIVPGKVLGSGVLKHQVVIAAYSFTRKAREKIENAGGKAITIPQLIKENPRGKGVRIVC